MKKTLCKILAVVLMAICVVPALVACTPRSEKLIIYTWGDYTDIDICKDEFPEYYKNITGKKIKVDFRYFATNEEMEAKLSGKVDYDLICPSEYTLQKLIREGKIEKLSRNDDGSYKYLTENTENINNDLWDYSYTDNGTEYNFSDYAVPYMWGTIGILYNIDDMPNIYDVSEVSSWNALLNPTGTNEFSMKDSMREAYFIGTLYNHNQKNNNELTDLYGQPGHKEKLQAVVDDTSDATIRAVEEILKAQSNNALLKGYESDEGKGMVVSGEVSKGLMWSGDAVWSFVEDFEAKKDINNKTLNSVRLAYYVPHEGSNVWTDYFAIPTCVVNKEAAEIFLDFICDTDIAVANMSESGYTSGVKTACEAYRNELEDDAMWNDEKITSRGDDFAEWYKQMYLDTLFPTDEVLARCAVMNDFGSRNTAIADMWRSAKS